MTDTSHTGETASTTHAHHGPHHPASFYIKIWAILVVLLVVSIAGPMLGHPIITLITAFGIALVKAYLVAANFMHLNIEKKLASILLVTCLLLLGVFFGGVAPDIMKHQGDQWVNAAAIAETDRRIATEGEHGEKMHHGEEGAQHGGEHGNAEHTKPE